MGTARAAVAEMRVRAAFFVVCCKLGIQSLAGAGDNESRLRCRRKRWPAPSFIDCCRLAQYRRATGRRARVEMDMIMLSPAIDV